MQEIWRGDRRRFLGGVYRLGKALTVGGVALSVASPFLAAGCSFVEPQLSFSTPAAPVPVIAPKLPPESLEEIVGQVREFEARIGNKGLTFYEAQTYIPLISKLFTRQTESPMSWDQLAQNTYILRGHKRVATNTIDLRLGPVKDPFSFQTVKDFQEDYPSVAMTEDLAQVLAGVTDNVGGLFWNGMTFLVTGDSASWETDGREQQYEGSGFKLRCGSVIPIVKTRSRMLHEYTHADGDTPFIPVRQDFFDAYFKRNDGAIVTEKQAILKGVQTRVLVIHPRNNPEKESAYLGYGLKSNFMFHFSGFWPDSNYAYDQDFVGLNEHVTEYLGSRISVLNNLPYTLAAYGDPYAFKNLEIILSQAGIDYRGLLKMYRNTGLEDFYLRIADGAKNISFPSDFEKWKFGLTRIDPMVPFAYYLAKDDSGNNFFTPYYPEVSTDRYLYESPELYKTLTEEAARKYILGCTQ